MADDRLQRRRLAAEAGALLPVRNVEMDIRLDEARQRREERPLAIGGNAEIAALAKPRHQLRIDMIPGGGHHGQELGGECGLHDRPPGLELPQDDLHRPVQAELPGAFPATLGVIDMGEAMLQQPDRGMPGESRRQAGLDQLRDGGDGEGRSGRRAEGGQPLQCRARRDGVVVAPPEAGPPAARLPGCQLLRQAVPEQGGVIDTLDHGRHRPLLSEGPGSWRPFFEPGTIMEGRRQCRMPASS